MNYTQIVDICCSDLRRYLERALTNTKGGVITVKTRRLLRAELPPPDRARYSKYVDHILGAYRWKRGTYVMPRQDALKVLETFDELCSVEMRRERLREPPPWRQGEMVQTQLYLPTPMVRLLDEYAREVRTSRSEVIRYAIYQLLMKYRGAEPQAPEYRPYAERAHSKQYARVSLHLPPDLLSALDEYAAALQTTRATVVRYAVARMLRRIAEEATSAQVAP